MILVEWAMCIAAAFTGWRLTLQAFAPTRADVLELTLDQTGRALCCALIVCALSAISASKLFDLLFGAS